MLWAVSQHPQQRTTQKTEAEVVLWLLIKKKEKIKPVKHLQYLPSGRRGH